RSTPSVQAPPYLRPGPAAGQDRVVGISAVVDRWVSVRLLATAVGVHSGAHRVLRPDNRLFAFSEAVHRHRCRHLGYALYIADNGGRPRVPFSVDLLDAGILDFHFSEPGPGQALHGALRRTQPGRRRTSLRARLL